MAETFICPTCVKKKSYICYDCAMDRFREHMRRFHKDQDEGDE